jgi:hypothetical protein
MNSGILLVLVLFSDNHSMVLGVKCARERNTAETARTIVELPGVSYRPSTGTLLTISKLNNTNLRGHFISHSGITVYFSSSFNGEARIWLEGGANIMLHEPVSPQRDIYMLKMKERSFVYDAGRAGLAYKLSQHHRSKKGVEYQYNQRRHMGSISDEIHITQALEELVADENSRLVVDLSMALGEFGVYGHRSPCVLPLYAMALSISHYSQQGGYKVSSSSDCAHDETSAKRVRRSWWFFKKEDTCTSLKNDPNNDDCLGMCGKKCDCWKFVCGDCCKHKGCLEHDKCCASKGTSSMDCLLVIPLVNFSCKNYTRYPNCITDRDEDVSDDREDISDSDQRDGNKRKDMEHLQFCGNLTANRSAHELQTYIMNLTGISLENISSICSKINTTTITPTPTPENDTGAKEGKEDIGNGPCKPPLTGCGPGDLKESSPTAAQKTTRSPPGILKKLFGWVG